MLQTRSEKDEIHRRDAFLMIKSRDTATGPILTGVFLPGTNDRLPLWRDNRYRNRVYRTSDVAIACLTKAIRVLLARVRVLRVRFRKRVTYVLSRRYVDST